MLLFHLPQFRVKKWTIYYRDFTGSGGDIPRPTGSSIHCCDRNTRSSRPLLLTDRCITLLSQPRYVVRGSMQSVCMLKAPTQIPSNSLALILPKQHLKMCLESQ